MMIKSKKGFIRTLLLSTTILLGLAQAPVMLATAADNGPGTTDNNLSGNTGVSGETGFVAETGTNAVANSTAEFTVDPGQLQLIAVPDFNFGNVNANTVVGGGEQALASNAVSATNVTSKNVSAFDGNSNGDLIVSDFRGGTGEGWHLTVGMTGDFKAVDASGTAQIPLSGIGLTLSGTGTNTADATQQLPLAGTNITGATAQTVTNAAVNTGAGTTKYQLNQAANAKLIFPAATNPSVSTSVPYQSDITWTLIASPTA